MSIRLQRQVPLGPQSTFHIGGYAEYLVSVRRPEDLIAAVLAAQRSRLPYKILAGGSNVVFPDTFLQGLLIRIRGGKSTFHGTRCRMDAGVRLTHVIRESVGRGLKGLETLSGIPGSVGGAIVGNGGANGHSIAEVIDKVEIWDGRRRLWLPHTDCRFRYRKSVFKEKPYLVLRAVLKLRLGDAKALKRTSHSIIGRCLQKSSHGTMSRMPGRLPRAVYGATLVPSRLVMNSGEPCRKLLGHIWATSAWE